MKLLRIYAATLAFIIWGCEGVLDEPEAGTLTESSGDATQNSYRLSVTMKSSANASKNVSLRIRRDTAGNPTCVDVKGFDKKVYSLKLEKRGDGTWQTNKNDAVGGTFDRYQQSASDAALSITMHWIKKRGSISDTNLSDAKGRLEHLEASSNNGTLYMYHSDADKKSNLAKGSLAPNAPAMADFNEAAASCS